MVGTWRVVAGDRMDDGTWIAGEPTTSTITWELKGAGLLERTELRSPHLATERIVLWSHDRVRGVFRVAVLGAGQGVMDVYEGSVEGDRLVVTNAETGTLRVLEDGTEVKVRLELTLGDPDAFTLDVLTAPADGDEWRPTSRIAYERTSGA